LSNPRVSVVTAVFNGELYIAECVRSVLAQTWTDFEFIVVDDGSTDDTWQVLQKLSAQDPRVVLLRNQPNQGVVKSLNRGLDRSKGQVIVRQDADDVSHPERIQKQLAFLDAHPDYGVVAAVPTPVDTAGREIEKPGWTAATNEEIQAGLLDYMCLCGPTIAVRREALEKAGFYFAEGLDATEDYDICLRLAEVTKLASLPKGLYRYRQHPESASNRKAQQQMFNTAVALERAAYRRYGENPPQDAASLIGRDYLHAAVIAFARNDSMTAGASLARALSSYPPILEKDEPLWSLLRSYTPSVSIEAALDYTNSVFSCLLPAGRRMSRLRSRLLADLHMSQVFEAACANQWWRVEEHLAPAIRLSPRWLLNRGVAAIVLKTLFRHVPANRRGQAGAGRE
jgi:glycosyltransferase involved in cell wall biosynthesis